MAEGTGQPGLQVRHELAGPAVVITVAGEIDLATVPALDSELRTALELVTPPAPIVLDLTEVDFLGSAGLAAITQATREARDRQVPVRLVATDRAVLRPIEITGLESTLTLCASRSDALAMTEASERDSGSPATR